MNESSLLSSRHRGSGYGSARGIRRKSKAEPESDALMKRVKKDNTRLLKELEEAEAAVKELSTLQEQNDSLMKEIQNLRVDLVPRFDVEKVMQAIQSEKTALTVIHIEKDNVHSEILSLQKTKKNKSRRSQ